MLKNIQAYFKTFGILTLIFYLFFTLKINFWLLLISHFCLFYFIITLTLTYLIYYLIIKKNKTTQIEYSSILKDKELIKFKIKFFNTFYSTLINLFIFCIKYNTRLKFLFLIFGILNYGILIFGILKNIFFWDVLYFPSDIFLNFDNQNSEPTEPIEYTKFTEPTNTRPVEPIEFTEPTGATEYDIYLANRPKEEIVKWILADIKNGNPDYSDWLNKNLIQQSKEVNYSFFKWEGKYAALKAGHLENSPGFNEYVNKYTAYYMNLSDQYGYYNYSKP